MATRELKSPFIVHSPLTGQRREGDYGAYPLPAETPEPEDPKAPAPPAEDTSQALAPPTPLQSVPVLQPPDEKQS